VGLLGRLFTILIAVLVIEFAVSTLLFEQSSRDLIREDEARRLAEHVSIARKLVSEQAAPERPRMAERLTTSRYEIAWAASPPPRATPDPAIAQLRGQMLEWEPGLARAGLDIGIQRSRRHRVSGSVRLADGSWLRFAASAPVSIWQSVLRRVTIALLPASVLLLAGVLAFRSTLRPMRSLAMAAERIGHGAGVRLPEAGPGEVRRVIRAFNGMQARIRQLITDRTEALAAVGHDLRTPLARLELRTDAIPDPALRAAIAGDVGEMEAMLSSLLAYLGGDDDPEKPVLSDVAVLAATLIDDVQDRGRDGEYLGPDHLETMVRPLTLKRSLSNLIENALHYGDTVRLILTPHPDRLVFSVIDDGPGIPEDKLLAVFQPFERLDPARGRNTSGLGLGLAIVQRSVEREGGQVRLVNRPEGGLCADIMLPRRNRPPAA
jgi:signal transduction histidine kinase